MARKTTTSQKEPAKAAAAKPAPTDPLTPKTEALQAVQTDAKDDAKTMDTPTPSLFDQAVEFSGADQGKARELWENLGCEDLPPMLAVALFDCAVKQGEKIAMRLLNKTIAPYLDKAITAELDAATTDNFLSWRLRRYAFTAQSALYMQDWSLHILKLHSFVLNDLHPQN